jgi:membrane associated rhomboid family serine protease
MTQFRPGSFQILPVIIKNLLIINGLVYLAQLTLDGLVPGGDLAPRIGKITDLFALHHILSPLFKPWQLVTHLFLHGSFMHILGNMFALWMFGSILENLWGPKRFLVFYLMCGLGAAVLHLASLWYESMPLLNDFKFFREHPSFDNYVAFFKQHPISPGFDVNYLNQIANSWLQNPGSNEYAGQAIVAVSDYTHQSISEPTLGASGAVFGCLAAFGYLFPNSELMMFPIPIPIKAKWFVTGYIVLELFFTWQNSAGDNVAHLAHLGGALVGFLLVYFWNRTNRRQFY